jgi:hypothetical protein
MNVAVRRHTVLYMYLFLLPEDIPMSASPSKRDFPSVESLRIHRETAIPTTRVTLPSVRARKRGNFLPALPEPLFVRLVALPGKALAVYLVLLQRSRVAKAKTIPLTTVILSRFGLSRWDKRSSLPALERAGLVRVERRRDRNPLVTLLDHEEED